MANINIRTASKLGDIKTVKSGLASGVEIDAVDADGRTALHWAADKGQIDILKLLLAEKANVNALAKQLMTPLACAASSGENEAVKLLVEAGADVELGDNRNWTPLHYAATHDNVDAIKILLDAGADRNARDKQGKPPAKLAKKKPTQDFLEKYQPTKIVSVSAASGSSSSKKEEAEILSKEVQAVSLLEESEKKLKSLETKPTLSAQQTHELEAEKQHNAELVKQIEEQKRQLAEMQSHVISPARVALDTFITSVKKLVTRLGGKPKRLFISYAWYVEEDKKKSLHDRLRLLKADLTNAGATVLLDLENMQGDIDAYMKAEITASDHILLICTPKLKSRVEEENNNNMKKELCWSLEIQKTNPKFIIPLILDGDFGQSVPDKMDGQPVNIKGIICLDFTHEANKDYNVKYAKSLSGIAPMGLIQSIFQFYNTEWADDYKEKAEILDMKIQSLTK